MKITFSARHFDATHKLQKFAKAELMRINKFSDKAPTAEAILEENGNLKVADMRINAYGKTLFAKMEGDDFYKIIPKAVDKLEKQLKAAKSKVYSRG